MHNKQAVATSLEELYRVRGGCVLGGGGQAMRRVRGVWVSAGEARVRQHCTNAAKASAGQQPVGGLLLAQPTMQQCRPASSKVQ